MTPLEIASVQFEHKSGDKRYNLNRIYELSKEAKQRGAEVVCFHECSITGYTFVHGLSRDELLIIAENISDSQSVKTIQGFAEELDVIILAGLFEKDESDKIYKAFVCVNKKGLVAKHRKLHPFINPNILPGNSYTIFELKGWKCGILICYDNNIIEHVRATNLLGADILFMPHVTMCTPSPRPGAGFIDPKLWENRQNDPTSLRLEFDSMKGRAWLMKWLPSRAYDNAMYVVFSNAIGMDADQVKNGCSMIIDPYGDIIAECRQLGDDICNATISVEPLTRAGGYRYKMARRPDLYKDILGGDHKAIQKVAWLDEEQKKSTRTIM